MNRENNRSIVTRVVIGLVSTVTLVLVIVGTLGYQVYSRQQRAEIEQKLALGANQLAAGIALPLWNFDGSQIHKIMESAMQDREVYGVAIEGGGKSYAIVRGPNWSIVDAGPDAYKAAGLLTAQRDIVFSSQNLGVLRVYRTPKFLRERLTQTLNTLLGAVVVLDLLLTLILYLLLWRGVLNPLKVIEEFAASVSAGRKEEAIAISSPLFGEFAKLRNVLESMVDLLDARLTEVRESNERFWGMVSGFPMPLGIASPSMGRVMFVNRKFTEVMGYQQKDIPDLDTWFRLAYPEASYRQEAIAEWAGEVEKATREGREIHALPYTVTCKDGSVRMMEIGGVLSGGYVMAVFMDVTEQRKAEEAVHIHQEHLEDLVEQRTRELVEARDQAEAANRSKSVFLANMSHELRTPLNSVIGFSRAMAIEPDLAPRQQRNLEIINRAGNHLLTLINDILELSKIEAGKVELSRDIVDLSHLLGEVVDMLRPRVDQSGISLVVQTDGLPPAVLADAAKLRQVLLNLVANAVKFTPKGGVTLVVNGRTRGDTVRVEFRVSDTGIGIRAEDQQRVFEPFIQVGQSGERSGTGLGLAISRQYVNMMGGLLAVQSVPGQGSTFSFFLDLPISSTILEQATVDTARVVGVVPETRGYRVLVADDIPEMRLLLKELLEMQGLEVLEAEDGMQAQEIILGQRPQLVLMDWRMPKMDGIALTRWVREQRDMVQPRIIMLTANAFNEDRKAAIAAGVDDFMGKPIDMQVLYHMIERHVGIHFRREADAKERAQSGGKLEAEDVAGLSQKVHQTFAEALRELNASKIAEALEQIRAEDRELAERIEIYTETMQYRHLWQVFEILDA